MRLIVAAFAFVAMWNLGPVSAQTPNPSPEALALARDLVFILGPVEHFKKTAPGLIGPVKSLYGQNRPAVDQDIDAILPTVIEDAFTRMPDLNASLAAAYARSLSV